MSRYSQDCGNGMGLSRESSGRGEEPIKEADKEYPMSRRESEECGVRRAKTGEFFRVRWFMKSTLCIWQHKSRYNVHEGSFDGMMKTEASLEKKGN